MSNDDDLNNDELDPKMSKAFKLYHRMVFYPAMGGFLGLMISMLVLMKIKVIPSIGYEGLKWFLPIFVAALASLLVIPLIQIPRWKVKAYQKVDDVEILKALAIAANLISKDNSLWNRFEIMSSETRSRIAKLEAESISNHDARVTIHVKLLGEGVDVWRPVFAKRCGSSYLVLDGPSNIVPEEETWEFAPGSFVKGKEQKLADGVCLVAERI